MKIKSLYLMTCIAAVVAACSQPPRPPEEVVAGRAQARLDAIVARDFKSAWAFHTPGFRAQTAREDYAADMKIRPVHWVDGEVGEVACEEKRCRVTVSVTYEVPNAPLHMAGMGNTRPLTEIWIRVDGKWWYAKNE